MSERDPRTIVSAVVLIAVGVFTVLFAGANYEVGTIARIGPGMFPILLGALLVALGAVIAFQAVFRGVLPYERLPVDVPALLATGGALAGFALVVERFGVVPAIFVLVAAMATLQTPLRPLTVLALAAGLCVTAFVVFQLLLGLPFRFLVWPWR